ncbi:unnamed protein product [Aphanomyces euteiches]|uniref:Carbonic anhydrase n=1 Tax=Aphanomyces euteiches TaxID=100861 RepID=A0A6G0WH78_9STRA|nr:hypothetical protein Ae201684_015264 [Aphanomyces euteiches]KAH9071936.1 hypothetical protein Ae201684P_021074 [Aphanomyces euteiches]KAH9139280.1 hypothetical protein AeRB84_016447 [Aphanomyces euteiches]
MRFFHAALFALVSLAAAKSKSTGKRQSPIDLPAPELTPAGDETVELTLSKSSAYLSHLGKTVQAAWDGGKKGKLVLNGEKYKALQLHFHMGSEHLVDGEQYALEMHIVHQNVDDPDQLAVIGVLFEESDEANPFLDQIFPALEDDEFVNGTQVDLGVIHGKSLDLTPGTVFYRYPGSLTTPPYSENVEWLVSAVIQPISTKQLEAYSTQFPKPTARDIQRLHGREVTLVEL